MLYGQHTIHPQSFPGVRGGENGTLCEPILQRKSTSGGCVDPQKQMDEEGLARETVEAEKAHSVPSANQRPSKVGGAAPVHARGLRSRTPVFAGRRTRRSQPSGEPIHPSSTFVLFEPPWIGDVLLHW